MGCSALDLTSLPAADPAVAALMNFPCLSAGSTAKNRALSPNLDSVCGVKKLQQATVVCYSEIK